MNRSNRVVGYVLTATAFLACPCHLVFTLPLALGLLSGTALGAALGANTWLVVAGATAYFVVALAAGLYLLNRHADEERVGSSRKRYFRVLSKEGERNE